MVHASRDGVNVAGFGHARSGGPVRTCIGCRERCPDAQLLRVVVVDGVVTPDPRRRLPGRGAWVHPDAGCVSTASRRRAFGRALRLTGQVDTSLVTRYLGADPGA
ncbi:MAG: hypothetical protein BGO26_07970 [Actinobacteria bacterium 69-20]|nr:YlxR family protein [Actinomycetota bacterium]OJV30266.1 MAG: hypothetical protein BGO26_07970 [Actinobacteria bacterium 69-20]